MSGIFDTPKKEHEFFDTSPPRKFLLDDKDDDTCLLQSENTTEECIWIIATSYMNSAGNILKYSIKDSEIIGKSSDHKHLKTVACIGSIPGTPYLITGHTDKILRLWKKSDLSY
jgi:hypothetical protein